jgi:hypothetical protein
LRQTIADFRQLPRASQGTVSPGQNTHSQEKTVMNATASYFVRGIVAALSLSTSAQAAQANPVEGSYITTRDGVQLYYKA